MKTLASVLVAILATGCGEHYADLEAKFAATEPAQSNPLESSSISLISTRHDGAFSFNDVVDIYLEESDIYISVSFPFNLAHKPIRIPADAIAGCGMACFSKENRSTELYIPDTGTSLSVRNSEAVIDWCWNNKIPIIPGDIERDWKYNGKTLESGEAYAEQFLSRDGYNQFVHRSCIGY